MHQLQPYHQLHAQAESDSIASADEPQLVFSNLQSSLFIYLFIFVKATGVEIDSRHGVDYRSISSIAFVKHCQHIIFCFRTIRFSRDYSLSVLRRLLFSLPFQNNNNISVGVGDIFRGNLLNRPHQPLMYVLFLFAFVFSLIVIVGTTILEGIIN